MVDASSLLLIIKRRGAAAAEVLDGAHTIPLARYEIGNALRTSVQIHREATAEEAERTFENVLLGVSLMEVMEQGDEETMRQTLSRSLSLGTTFYDTSYITAAVNLHADLVTEDRSLADAARKAGIESTDAAALSDSHQV